jgi:hypothetical protein
MCVDPFHEGVPLNVRESNDEGPRLLVLLPLQPQIMPLLLRGPLQRVRIVDLDGERDSRRFESPPCDPGRVLRLPLSDQCGGRK